MTRSFLSVSRRTGVRWLAMLALAASSAVALQQQVAVAAKAPAQVLVYLDARAHNSLFPTAGGFYSNGAILNNIADKLTYQNPETLEIEPWLAQSWTINGDATVYTFILREGVTFSDGSPLDAVAVAANFDAFGKGNKTLKHSSSEVINNYERSEVVDPRTVRLYFSKPSPGFLQATSVTASSIVSPKSLALSSDELGDATKIIASGPFVVAKDVPGRETVLKAREDYRWGPQNFKHQGKAPLDEIRIVVNGEDGVRIGALLSGQASVIRQVQPYDEARIKAQNYLVYGASTRGLNHSLAFRPDNALVAELPVRQALVHATDKQAIIDTLFSPTYPVARSVLGDDAPGFVDLSAQIAFDPEKSKQLLEQAGWTVGADGVRTKNGQRLELATYASQNYARSTEVLQLIAQQWEKVGVKLLVRNGDSGSRTVDSLDPQKTPLLPAMVGRADPDVIKSNYYPTNRNMLLQKGGVSDKVQQFEDAKLNGLFDAIASEANPKRRLELTADVQRYLVEQAYTIPLVAEPQVFAAAPWVKDLKFDAVGRPYFYGISIAPH